MSHTLRLASLLLYLCFFMGLPAFGSSIARRQNSGEVITAWTGNIRLTGTGYLDNAQNLQGQFQIADDSSTYGIFQIRLTQDESSNEYDAVAFCLVIMFFHCLPPHSLVNDICLHLDYVPPLTSVCAAELR